MKLYTEDDVRKAIELAQDMYKVKYTEDDWQHTYSEKEIVAALNPIELPSDEEIENKINNDIHIESDADFFNGAKWMRDKIQEQQTLNP
jgi:hypothetical protein